MQQKIKSINEIRYVVKKARQAGQRIVHCHGVFDLIHPGHIHHLKEAKSLGDALIVSITPDRFVNKGPDRPAFREALRMEQLACLTFVDYVVLNDTFDAVSIIREIRPDIYVKGNEYQRFEDDVTGKIREEVEAVKEGGGEVHFTGGIVYSSSQLINSYVDRDLERIRPFLDHLKQSFSIQAILEKIEELSSLKVLVVGDAIIDEYQYVHPLGQSVKGLHMTAACLEKEVFLGGSLIIANHIASFAKEVTLLTAIGEKCPHAQFIRKNLLQKVQQDFIFVDAPTLTKRRYVLKDGETISKLFETYSSHDVFLNENQTEQVIKYLQDRAAEFDIVIIPDFGNGFMNPRIVDAICNAPTFLALNTQINSGNRGFHVVKSYQRADFISLNEPELRLAAHDRHSRVESLAYDIADLMHCNQLSVTKGVNGVYIHSAKEEPVSIPALTMHAIDRVGAGDCFFSLASLCAAKGFPALLSGFLGSAAAAMGVQIVGNKEAINKAYLSKYMIRLMK